MESIMNCGTHKHNIIQRKVHRIRIMKWLLQNKTRDLFCDNHFCFKFMLFLIDKLENICYIIRKLLK